MGNHSTYPRIIIINAVPFNASTATSRTQANLFQGWPRECLAQIYTARMTAETDICENYWHLSQQELAGVQWIRRLKAGAPRAASPISRIPDAPPVQTAPPHRRAREVMRHWVDLIPYRLPDACWQWLDDFHPEVVYTFMGNIRMMELSRRIADRYHIPIIPHFMDDLPSTQYTQFPYCFLQRLLLLKELRALLERAPMRLTISQAMADEYRERFGGSFEPFMNCVDAQFCDLSISRPPDSRSLRLAYVGNIEHGRFSLLLEIGRAAKALQAKGLDIRIQLHVGVLSSEQLALLAELAEVLIPDAVLDDARFRNIRAEVDGFVHVDSFLPVHQRYFRLSLSAKLPLYMVCGLPILAYGPANVGSIQYLRNTGSGMVVTEQCQDALQDALTRLTLDSEYRQRLGLRSREIVLQNHNAAMARELFRQIFAQVAQPATTTTVLTL